MSYEYKEKIKEDLEYSLEGVSIDYYSSEELIHKQKVKELDRVYAQAAKADEYESKAKAYDHIENLVKTELTSDDLYNDARNNDYVAGMLRVYEMVDYIIEEYESGGYDA